MHLGTEWIVEAEGCREELLRSVPALKAVVERLVRELDLHVLGQPLWHAFPGAGGITGLCLLSESHLTCHTYPEHRCAAFNLFCCRERAEWPWAQRLAEMLGATRVTVRRVPRGEP